MSKMLPYPVFDFHTHCFPDAIAPKTVAYLGEKASLRYHHDGTYAGLCEYERDADGFLVLPIATKPSQTRSILQFAASIDGDGKARSLGSVHPHDPDYESWLDVVVDTGLAGIKLHPEYQDFAIDDDSLWAFYEAVFARNLLLVLHAGDDLGFDDSSQSAPERIARLCDRFPDSRIVAAHMGGFNQWEHVSRCLAGRPNLWLDCSFGADRMPGEQFASLARAHGLDRILFGTDAPWASLGDTAEAVLRAGFAQDELRGIFYGNAAKLLGMEDH